MFPLGIVMSQEMDVVFHATETLVNVHYTVTQTRMGVLLDKNNDFNSTYKEQQIRTLHSHYFDVRPVTHDATGTAAKRVLSVLAEFS